MAGVAGEDHGDARPSSPALPPVRLSDCIEEILRFTLAGSLADLTADYCSRLLQDDPLAIDPNLNDFCSGVPSYPLYKHLARALGRSMVDESSAMGESEWKKRIVDTGMELSNMLEAVEFELHVQEPFFSQLRDGKKTVEGRCATGNYNRIAPGSLLLFNKCLLLKVQHVKWYNSFFEMLEIETLANVLPGVEKIEEGVHIYRKFYTEEKEMTNGVLAISVSKLDSQPYISMATLLSGLSYDGIGHLLGMMHTIGTISDALPPPRSSLISSSMKPHRPNVKGCSLTNAARALTKHVYRSSDGWWGSLLGSDFSKNGRAWEVINHLLTNCCWMNAHLIQPYECL